MEVNGGNIIYVLLFLKNYYSKYNITIMGEEYEDYNWENDEDIFIPNIGDK